MRLWPHAWPMPGRQSAAEDRGQYRYLLRLKELRHKQDLPISALNDTTGPRLPVSKTATQAVSMP